MGVNEGSHLDNEVECEGCTNWFAEQNIIKISVGNYCNECIKYAGNDLCESDEQAGSPKDSRPENGADEGHFTSTGLRCHCEFPLRHHMVGRNIGMDGQPIKDSRPVTVPHPDRCTHCGTYCKAFDEVEKSNGYYLAYYNCSKCSNTWTCTWAVDLRMLANEIDDEIVTLNTSPSKPTQGLARPLS